MTQVETAVRETPAAPQIQMIATGRVIPTPDNPRVIRDNDPKLLELAASIRQFGILMPLLGRPHPTSPGLIDLRAGERRWRAALLVELATVPMIVREMSDAEALEVTVLENLQRENLHPLEEAAGVATLLERRGWNQTEVAAHLGKSERWVARRAAIARLSPRWREQFLDPESPVSGWSAAHMEILAPFSHDVQDAALEEFRRHSWYWDRMDDWTSGDVADRMQRHCMALKSAPWKLDDATLSPAAGPCSACPQRDDVQADLFDAADPERVHCLNAACWKSKMEAYVAGRVERETARGVTVVALTTDSGPGRDRTALCGAPAVFKYDYTEAKKGESGAVLAIDPEDGKSRWMKKLQRSGGGGGGRTAGRGAGPLTMADRRAALERTREKLVCQRVEGMLDRVCLRAEELLNPLPEGVGGGGGDDDDMPPMPALGLTTVAALAMTFGVEALADATLGSGAGVPGEDWSGFDALVSDHNDVARYHTALTERLLLLVAPRLTRRLHSGILYCADPPIAEAERVCRLFEWDHQAIVERVRSEKPEPASWRKLEAEEQAAAAAKRQKQQGKTKTATAGAAGKPRSTSKSKPKTKPPATLAPTAPIIPPAPADCLVSPRPGARYFKGKRSEASIGIEMRAERFVHCIYYKFLDAGSGPLAHTENPDEEQTWPSEREALAAAVERFERILDSATLKLAAVSKPKRAECAKMLEWARGLAS